MLAILYKITYAPELDGAGFAKSFEVHARPITYRRYLGDISFPFILGSITRRSLVTNETGIVHYTEEDKKATMNGPELEEVYFPGRRMNFPES